MNFGLSDEQRLIVETARRFVAAELIPHEDEIERHGTVPPDLVTHVRKRAIDAGIYAANMPAELGGGGLDTLTMTLVDRELGATTYALHSLVVRPSNILLACEADQVDRYLLPAIRGQRVDCLAMTEPEAGSDMRSMKTRAVRDGDEFVVTGTKHFISHVDLADFVILFAVTGEARELSVLLVDLDSPGLTVAPGYQAVSNRGYHNSILQFDECRVPAANLLGELHRGWELAGEWLGSTRLQVAALCLGRARRALDLAVGWAAEREQFGRKIGKFQGVAFKLADMQTRYEAAELLTLRAAWKADEGTMTDADAAMAKVFATEMCQDVTDEAIQVFGGMGLMADLPLERMWRDTRVDRIWDGTSEIQRHIISRSLLRPRGG